jgi:iron complex outermembrane receptor protein
MKIQSKRAIWLAGASGLAALMTVAAAQAAEAPAAAEVEGVIVTGTRTTGLKAVDSPAPITVLGADVLKRTGQPDLIQSLAQNIPSMQAQATGTDTTTFHLSIKLRGLSPNHTLVLVNGKRRHATSNVVITAGAFSGNAAADIGLIPVGEIDHVEVLQEGAAAQYGTDAIAGVVNIILKKADHGGSIIATGGEYIDGGGRTGDLAVNIGLAPIDKAYLNMTIETKYHEFSFRGDLLPGIISSTTAGAALLAKYPTLSSAPNYPYLARGSGDAKYRSTIFMYNGGYDFSDHLQFYTFGSGAYKWGQAWEGYRIPSTVLGKMPGDVPFPQGFDPQEALEENDYSFTAGLKGDYKEWTWDLATTYGYEIDKVFVLNSSNISLYSANSTATTKGFAPSTYHDGDYSGSQWTTTFDVTHDFEVGLAGPLNFAAGLEYRKERYGIAAGDPASYFGTGAASFFGYGPTNAGNYGRHSVGGYMDFAVTPVKQLKLDAAVRYETYSDFGNTTVAKLTSRYDFNDAIALRGTVSTGFRAPTLAEEFYSGINVGPTSVSGVFAPNSPGAKQLGLSGLGPEKSKNYSVGVVTHFVPGLTMTLDAYQIDITDRIVQSGNFFGFNANKNVIQSPSVIAALIANGITIDPSILLSPSGTVSVVSFVNGVDTRTRGADFVATYPSDFGEFGHVDWAFTANYNDTKVTRIAKPPSNVDSRVILLDKIATSTLETTTPKWRITAGGLWTWDKVTVNLRESVYGSSFAYAQDPVGAFLDKIEIKQAFITDLEASYQLFSGVKLSAGANNLFNKYPSKNPAAFRAAQYSIASAGYATQYPAFAPFGFNGGYYYGKLTLTF